jgi:asparaginyl-tRNA synthetase
MLIQMDRLSTGDTVELEGVWRKCPPGLAQEHELHTSSVEVVGAADPQVGNNSLHHTYMCIEISNKLFLQSYPLQKKYHGPDFLRQIPHLRLRTPFNSQLARFRSECIYHISDFFRNFCRDNEFVQVHPPLITSSDCEGAGEAFAVSSGDPGPNAEHFFRDPRYLTVSSQLHLEAYAADLGSVWALSPTFRAEKSDTPRHLSEFYMLEAEMNFVNSLEEVMSLVENMIRHLVGKMQANIAALRLLSAKTHINDKFMPDTKNPSYTLDRRWKPLVTDPWIHITYTDAMIDLQNAHSTGTLTFKQPPSWQSGLNLEHEKALLHLIGKNTTPIFVTHYPKHLKPFYMAPSHPSAHSSPPPGETVANFDLLLPEICEVVGGSLREHGLESLITNMRSSNLLKKIKPYSGEKYPFLAPDESLGALQWYADLRRWGTAPHGGFGLGFDRLIAHLAGVSSLRDVVAFPRWYGRCDC